MKKYLAFGLFFSSLIFVYLYYTLTFSTEGGDLLIYFNTYSSSDPANIFSVGGIFNFILKFCSYLFSFRLVLILLSTSFVFLYFRYAHFYYFSTSLAATSIAIYLILYPFFYENMFTTTLRQCFLYVYIFFFRA